MDKLTYTHLEELLQELLRFRVLINLSIRNYPLDDIRKFKKKSTVYKSLASIIDIAIHDLDYKDPDDINIAIYELPFFNLFRAFEDSNNGNKDLNESLERISTAYKRLLASLNQSIKD